MVAEGFANVKMLGTMILIDIVSLHSHPVHVFIYIYIYIYTHIYIFGIASWGHLPSRHLPSYHVLCVCV